MKSCVIIGNPNSPRDEELRYHNLYPTILYLIMMAGFTHVYLTPNNSYERMAFFDYARCIPTLETLTLVMYDFSCVGEVVFPSKAVPPDGVIMGDIQTALSRATHVLYVGYTQLPPCSSHQTAFNLTLEQLQDNKSVSNEELAKSLGIKPSALRSKIRRIIRPLQSKNFLIFFVLLCNISRT